MAEKGLTHKPKIRGNGTGTVYKRGNTWVAEITVGYRLDADGKRRRIVARKMGLRTKAIAMDAITDLKRGTEKRTKITLNDYWMTFSENQMQKLSKSKQGHYRTAKAKIEYLFLRDIRDLDIDTLQTAVNEAAPTYYPARDIKDLLSTLYDRAVAEQVVGANLAVFIDLPKKEEEEPNPFNEEEVRSLWKDYYAGNWVTGYALLMIYTGMMPGELFDLNISSINLERNTIVGAGKKTKKRKETPIVLADCIIPVVEDLMQRAKPDGTLLPMHRDTYRMEFKQMLVRCGCRQDLVPYSCRHTTATSLALENIAMPIIKEVMRHTQITTTQRYVHIDTQPMIDAVNAIKSDRKPE